MSQLAGRAGTHIAIQAADGSSTLCAHPSSRSVAAGDRIEAGVTPGGMDGATDPLAYLAGLGLAL